MAGSSQPFTAAQRLRAIALDILEVAEIAEQPSPTTVAAECRAAAIEELAMMLWAVGRGRRPLGWR